MKLAINLASRSYNLELRVDIPLKTWALTKWKPLHGKGKLKALQLGGPQLSVGPDLGRYTS